MNFPLEPSTSNCNSWNENDGRKIAANAVLTTSYNFTTVIKEQNHKRSLKDQKSPSKPLKLKKKDEGNKVEMAAIQEQSSDFYKLPVELLFDIFDYLPLKVLCAVRQTSKLFHQVAESCFQKKYSNLVRNRKNQRDSVLSPFHKLIPAILIEKNYHLISNIIPAECWNLNR